MRGNYTKEDWKFFTTDRGELSVATTSLMRTPKCFASISVLGISYYFVSSDFCLHLQCDSITCRTGEQRRQCSVCRLDSSHYIEHFACVDFTEFLFLLYPFNRTGLGLIVFGLGLTRHVWSRSRSHSLWSRSHCVMVSLTSLVGTNYIGKGKTERGPY